jgi:hypothetical protein
MPDRALPMDDGFVLSSVETDPALGAADGFVSKTSGSF